MGIFEYIGLWPYLLTVAFGGIVWAMRRTIASTERVEKLENRLTEMETKYANMPGVEDMQEMRLRMTEIAGDMKVIGQRVQSMTHQIELLLENAVNRSK